MLEEYEKKVAELETEKDDKVRSYNLLTMKLNDPTFLNEQLSQLSPQRKKNLKVSENSFPGQSTEYLRDNIK